MKACDQGTIEYYGVPSLVLMERAALSVVDEVITRVHSHASVLIVCGSGNNGGDGIAIGRLLYLKGYKVKICFVGSESSASEETAAQIAIAKKYNVPFCTELPHDNYDVLIDSIFGIGLCREIQGKYKAIIEHMNDMSGLKIAVDISSGIHGDSGKIMGIAFQADVTVTFAFAKIGHLLYPGASYTGELCVKEIGIDEYGFLGNYPKIFLPEKTELLKIPARPDHSNKGTFGKVLVIAGTVNMAGAACFSAKAAYRTGAGLVRVLTHESNRVILQSLVPEAVLTTYEEKDSDLRVVKECLEWASVIVLGPGIGQSTFSKVLVETVLSHASVPCIIDADGLNLIARERYDLSKCTCDLILTPHLGEMARLIKSDTSAIAEDLIFAASNYAKQSGKVVVLKDARTVTAVPNGEIYINCSGNSGMATAGSGDVLTGIIAGLLCQGCSIAQSAYTGVYLHGLAGDFMSQKLCRESLMASDIIEGITMVLKEGH